MNSEGNEIVRCVIEGTLTTRSFLHIGGSENAEFVPPTDVATVAPVVTGHDGRAIVPGSALRGSIRSQLKKVGYTDAQIDKMMGKAASEKDAIAIPGKARRVFVRTAVIEEGEQLLTFDDQKKGVDHISMTAINRWRRAPADGSITNSDEEASSETDNTEANGDDAGRSGGMLRTVEAVPPGVTFKAWVGIAGDAKEPLVKGEEIAAIMAALQQFNAMENSLSDATLGAFRQQGWGQLQWENSKISVLTKHALKEWLKQPQQGACGEQGWGLCTKAIDVPTVGKPESQGRTAVETFTIDLELHGQSTFLTADTRERFKKAKDKKAKDNIEPDARVMRTADGKVYVSGHSIKGALRSHLERILRTRGIPCCDPTLDERKTNVEGAPSHIQPRCQPIRKVEEVESLCLACQILGAGGWASTIAISPFIETAATKDKPRQFVGISRFTGGGADKLKFSASVADRPNLRGRITFNLKRLAIGDHVDAKLGALLHLFRDFAEGDIRIGAGGSKGMGVFDIKLTESHAPEPYQEEHKALLVVLKKDEGIAKNEKGGSIAATDSMKTWLEAFDMMATDKKPTKVIKTPALLWDRTDVPSATEDRKQLTGSFNPYHWVPAVSSPVGLFEPVTEFGSKDHQRHDVYAVNGYSGEFTVQIKTVTPIFVGGVRKTHDGQPATVKPYKIDEAPAIPATSLRGLISSIYEIATASAMRVLESETIYSFRMEAKEAFKYIGKVTKHGSGLAMIPWARTPETRGRQDLPGRSAQPPDWKHNGANAQGTETVPTYYRLDNGKRDLPPSSQRHYEVEFNGNPTDLRPIPISQAVIDRFHWLADKRTKASEKELEKPPQDRKDLLPYEPIGQARGGKEHTYRLKEGDFVYFKADATGVADISLSQIWRSDVGESLGAKFGSIGKDIVPFNESRKNITMAEAVFGFVRIASKKDEGTEGQKAVTVKPLQAYASKVSLTDARFLNNVAKPFQDVITLKILDSPKPPSPAFYFEPMGNKTRLPKFTDLRPDHVTPPSPRGRKMYLHLKPSISTPWETSKTGKDLSDQQATVACIEKECKFQFTLAFDNLSGPELNALRYSLQPVPGFLHKLGMGKPLGLGSVELKVVAVRAVDRMQRYTAAGFQKLRFTKQRKDEDAARWTATGAKEWRDSIQDSNLKKSLRALEIIGTTQVETMQYPMTRTQSDGEKELFEWPSKNQRLGPDYGQYLVPIENGAPEGLLNLPWKRRPWAFHLVGIPDGNNQVQRGINSLPRGAASVKYVNNQSDAEKHIKTLDPNSVIFIVSANRLNWAGKITHRDVRYVPLNDLSKLTSALNLRTP